MGPNLIGRLSCFGSFCSLGLFSVDLQHLLVALVDPTHELFQRELQAGGEQVEGADAGLLLGDFEHRDVWAGDGRLPGKILLGLLELVPSSPDFKG